MTLGTNRLVVEVAKGPAHAAPPACAASHGERVVAADGEATRVDCTGLWRTVELELAVSHNGASATVLVVQDAILESAEKVTIGRLKKKKKKEKSQHTISNCTR